MGVDVIHYDGWTGLKLNRPEARNALNAELLGVIATILNQLATDHSCRAVVITGAQGNFAAGADIGEIEHKTQAEAALDLRKKYWADIRAFPKPMIAAVDGFALGGGFELALMADLLVLGSTARLGFPETSLGLIPGAGGGQRLMSLVGRRRANRQDLTGEIIEAVTAFHWGIGSHFTDGPAFPEAATLADNIRKRAPLAMVAAKHALIEGCEANLALVSERRSFEILMDSADKSEGIAAFRAKRPPRFMGK